MPRKQASKKIAKSKIDSHLCSFQLPHVVSAVLRHTVQVGIVETVVQVPTRMLGRDLPAGALEDVTGGALDEAIRVPGVTVSIGPHPDVLAANIPGKTVVTKLGKKVLVEVLHEGQEDEIGRVSGEEALLGLGSHFVSPWLRCVDELLIPK